MTAISYYHINHKSLQVPTRKEFVVASSLSKNESALFMHMTRPHTVHVHVCTYPSRQCMMVFNTLFCWVRYQNSLPANYRPSSTLQPITGLHQETNWPKLCLDTHCISWILLPAKQHCVQWIIRDFLLLSDWSPTEHELNFTRSENLCKN